MCDDAPLDTVHRFAGGAESGDGGFTFSARVGFPELCCRLTCRLMGVSLRLRVETRPAVHTARPGPCAPASICLLSNPQSHFPVLCPSPGHLRAFFPQRQGNPLTQG